MELKINTKNLSLFFISIIIIFNLNFFYFIDTTKFKIMGINLQDLAFYIEILFTFFVLFKYIPYIKFTSCSFSSISIICAFGLALIAAVTSINTYGQPFRLGVSSQHLWLGCVIFFFGINTLLQLEIIEVEDILKCLRIILFICSVVWCLQYFLSDKVQFLYLTISERYGQARYYYNMYYFILYIGFSIDELMQNNITTSKNKKNIFYIGMCFFIAAVMTKARMQLFTITGATLILIFLRKNKVKKKIYAFVAVGIAGVFFLSSSMGQDIIAIIWNGSSLSENTSAIRDSEREYYWNLVTADWHSFIFGCGSPNVNWGKASQILNPIWSKKEWSTAKYYLEDVGYYYILVKYGIVGILWWLIILIYSIKTSLFIYKKTDSLAYLFLPMVDLIGCITLHSSLFNISLEYFIYLALLERTKMDIINNQNLVC